jgi:hypothetical protein
LFCGYLIFAWSIFSIGLAKSGSLICSDPNYS